MLKHAILAAATSVLSLAMSAPAHADHLTPWWGGEGGTYFEASCASGYMNAVNARAGWYVDSVQAKCGNEVGLFAGGAGGNDVTRTCPEGQVVTGALIMSGSWVDSVHFLCAKMTDVANGSMTFSTTLALVGGSGGVGNPITQCPPNQAAIGLYGWAGQYINRLGLICREVP